MAVQNERVTLSLGPTAQVAAGTGVVHGQRWMRAGTWEIEAAYLFPEDAQTANGSNYATYTLKKGSTTVATRAYSATNSVAQTPEALSLTAGTTQVAEGDVLSWTKADTGTGLAGRNRVDLVLRRIS